MDVSKQNTVLIVEDEPDLREMIAYDFRGWGFAVFEAGCGREAFAIVQKEQIDVVVTDVRMANGDGVELLEKIKLFNAKKPAVIFLSGFSDLTSEEAYRKGAAAVLAKPFERKDLRAAVERAAAAVA